MKYLITSLSSHTNDDVDEEQHLVPVVCPHKEEDRDEDEDDATDDVGDDAVAADQDQNAQDQLNHGDDPLDDFFVLMNC